MFNQSYLVEECDRLNEEFDESQPTVGAVDEDVESETSMPSEPDNDPQCEDYSPSIPSVERSGVSEAFDQWQNL